MPQKTQEQLNANLILAARAGNVSAIRESIHSGAQVNGFIQLPYLLSKLEH